MAAPGVQHRTTCRICGAAGARRFLHFANMPLTDQFVDAATLGREFTANLDIHFCPACGTSQTLHDVAVGEYYRDYQYTVSASPFAQRFMDELARATLERFELPRGAAVLEIGSGDGYQLQCFQKRGARVLGFEPSAELTRVSRAAGVDVLQCLFEAGTIAQIPAALRPADAVLLTYTFDHLPQPREFLQAVRQVLDPQRGVLLLEVHDLEQILARRETCLFEHEHTIYLHAGSAARLLASAGFEVVTTELVPAAQRRGNSLLVAARVKGDDTARGGAEHLVASGAALDAWGTYEHFGQEVDAAYERMRGYVRAQIARGRRVAGYGAGGRGVMTLAMAGLGAREIAYLCDRNTGFHGRYTPATHVPVVPPERLAQDPVDEVIVFSYGYLAEIRAELRAVEERGTRFVSLLDLLR
jgi:SAM-dependent methyltransferase